MTQIFLEEYIFIARGEGNQPKAKKVWGLSQKSLKKAAQKATSCWLLESTRKNLLRG
jgi:hypothetical protein